MFCANCGKPMPEGSKFCGSCGGKIAQNKEIKPPDTAPLQNEDIPVSAPASPLTEPSKVEKSSNKVIIAVIAAVAVVVIGIGGFFLLNSSEGGILAFFQEEPGSIDEIEYASTESAIYDSGQPESAFTITTVEATYAAAFYQFLQGAVERYGIYDGTQLPGWGTTMSMGIHYARLINFKNNIHIIYY